MEALIISILAFCGAFLAVVAVNALLMDMIAAERRRLNREMEEQLRQRRRERLKDQGLEQLARQANCAKPSLAERLAVVIEQSGIEITARHLLTISAACALSAATIGGLLTGDLMLSVAAGA